MVDPTDKVDPSGKADPADKVDPTQNTLLVPGPPRYATRGNLSAVAGNTAKQQGKGFADAKAYDPQSAYEV
jgi:hypothetical protein